MVETWKENKGRICTLATVVIVMIVFAIVLATDNSDGEVKRDVKLGRH